jgi:hypothetical protein
VLVYERNDLTRFSPISRAVIVFVLLEAGSILALVFTGELEGFRDGLPGY